MNNLEIVSINNEQAVSGRLLHEQLEINTQYSKWITRYIEKYDLVENEDYLLVIQKRQTNNPKNSTTEIMEHILKLNHAKKI